MHGTEGSCSHRGARALEDGLGKLAKPAVPSAQSPRLLMDPGPMVFAEHAQVFLFVFLGVEV